MSGYRSLHREKVGDYPIWQVVSGPLLTNKSWSTNTNSQKRAPSWRIWAACGDGLVRGFLVREKSLETTTTQQQDVLDASACSCTCTHLLLGANGSSSVEPQTSSPSSVSIGCSQVRLARNYVGDDEMAGDQLVVSIDLTGKIRIWSLSETMDDDSEDDDDDDDDDDGAEPKQQHQQQQHVEAAVQEFSVENATGTCLQICPPKISVVGDILVAVARLDGTIAIVATGLVTPAKTATAKDPMKAGTIVDVWSKPGSIAMSSDWHPFRKSLAVGRQDGLVEILGEKPHRLIHHEAPVRAVQFTPDAQLLVTASDDGMLAVWDLGRSVPVLVHHVLQAHASWILSLTALTDSRRFLSCGADRKLHVWSAGQLHQSMHTFNCDDTVWTIHAATTPLRGRTVASGANAATSPLRMISGSENGGLQIYSLEP